jgi:signal transduction histidine kinase
VPSVTVERRLAEEAQALVDEGGVLSVELIDPTGAAVLSRAAPPSTDSAHGAAAGLPEDVILAAPLSDFRVRAVARPPDGVAPLALLLGVAAALTTLALFLGASALARAAARSAQLAEDRKRFLDHVAHEVRTPSAALLNLSEELAAGHVAAERLPLYLQHLHREAGRLAELVDDTLDLTRLEAGRLTLHRERADLRVLLHAEVAPIAAQPTAATALPDVTTHVPVTPVTGTFDRSALTRTLRTLVDNAVHHGGGEQSVEVTLTARDGRAVVTVCDHGRGIDAAHLPHIFERFYRVPSSTHEAKGVGLGLSLCREVVEAHKGTLTVISTPGAGATFTVELPLGGVAVA